MGTSLQYNGFPQELPNIIFRYGKHRNNIHDCRLIFISWDLAIAYNYYVRINL